MARVVFFGTPSFGVPILRALIQHHEVPAVVTQPDRPAGRGRKLQSPPVKELAEKEGIRVLQPANLRRDQETIATLQKLGADIFVIAAYGQILRPNVLHIPPYGCIGVHASLLPKLRGAAPITAAILQGEKETGITLMLTDEGMDTGPIIAQRKIQIAPDETTETLSAKLAQLGAELLIETLPAWLAGQIEPIPQDESQATYAPRIKKEDGRILWHHSATEIDRQIRAFTPWPGTYCYWQGKPLKILKARPLQAESPAPPGTVIEHKGEIAVTTGEGLLILERVQLAGKRAMEIQDFIRGQRLFLGSTLA